MPQLAKLLRELRDGKTLREIAELTGISPSYISDLENARLRDGNPAKPSPDRLYRLSVVYDVPLRRLMELAKYSEQEIEEVERRVTSFASRDTEVELTDIERRIRDKVLAMDNTSKMRVLDFINRILDEDK